MRDRFWSMYTEIQFNYFYFWQYRNSTQRIDFILRVLSTFTTGAGVACLLLERNAPMIWAILIAISQTYQAIQHLLPFQERITKLDYYLPPIQKLLNEIKRKWEYIDSFSEDEIIELIYDYQDQYINIEQNFIGTFPFPHKKSCKKKADKALKDHFDYHYNFDNTEGGK